MTSCVFRYCKNTGKNIRESSGISFHRFVHPGHQKREKWIKIVQQDRSEATWLPTKYSSVCSAHFRADDFYTTKTGKRYLRNSAIPCSNPSEYAENTAIPASPTSLDHVEISDSESIFDSPGKIQLKKKLSKVSAARRELSKKVKKLQRQNRDLRKKTESLRETVKQLKGIRRKKQMENELVRPEADAVEMCSYTIHMFQPTESKLHAEAGASSDLLACRVCLETDGRLLPISDSGFEDIFAILTGVQLSMEGLPRYLCAFCRAKLSKCVAFRDSCQRSTALLQTLLEKGPLTMKDIEAIDRETYKLTHGMTREKVFHYLTHPYLQIPPIKTEDDETSESEIPDRIDEVYLEIDQRHFIKDPNTDFKDNDAQVKIGKVKLEEENSIGLPDSDNYADLDTSESHTNYIEMEIEAIGGTENCGETDSTKKTSSAPVTLERGISTKTTKRRAGNTRLSKSKQKRKKIGDDVYPVFDYEAFEEEFSVKIKLLSIEDQKQEIEEKKKANKSVFCCEMCGKGCNTDKTMKNHLSCHDPSMGPLECEICRCRFRAAAGVRLQRHRDKHRLRFACRDCGFVSRDKSNAKLHSIMHSGKTFACQHCGQTYRHRTSYLTHVRERHPAENVVCDECGDTFVSENGVRQHKAKAHGTDPKPESDVKCSVCDAKFLSIEALRKHTSDEGVPHAALWPCAACGESCGSELALAAHAAERHPPEQHYCEECGVTFASGASFAQHTRRKHLGVTGHGARQNRSPRARGSGPAPRVVCEVCGRSIQNEAVLKFHMYTHMEQKPYACPLCPKTFAGKTFREFHLRTHTGSRPYQCAECPLACTLKGTLARHIARVHMNPTRRRFSCDICQKTFTEHASVKLHVRTVHNNMPAPRRVRNAKKVAGSSSLSVLSEYKEPSCS